MESVYVVRGWDKAAAILVCDVVHEDGSTLRHSEQCIFLNLRIRRQDPLRKTLDDRFGEVEVLEQVQQGCSARRRSSGELLRSRMGGGGGEPYLDVQAIVFCGFGGRLGGVFCGGRDVALARGHRGRGRGLRLGRWPALEALRRPQAADPQLGYLRVGARRGGGLAARHGWLHVLCR